jgi:hypothetical protein
VQFTTKTAITGLLTGLLAGCVAAPPVTGDLKSARDACNRNYPARIGNYLPHAHCVNAAIETYALPAARYPDLVRLQAQVRASLSEKIDRRRISVSASKPASAAWRKPTGLLPRPNVTAAPGMKEPRPGGSRRSNKC